MMGRRMILMHEDWHWDTLGRSWNIYAVIAGFALLCSVLLCSAPLRSALLYPALFCSDLLGSVRWDFGSACLTKHRTAAILHPDFSGRRFARHVCTIVNGRIIRGNPVPDDLSLSLSPVMPIVVPSYLRSRIMLTCRWVN